ncbi:MAG TPA: SOS response-associated peptidase [Actinomycetota bacterium]|jgi:putative SOS response-associated peptidase YedK|nr:SOS response-associated peptidase [Actinomycetota bacterium]HRV66918.1 SOS response-associated peptidase [Candidatus Nanopelagicales bacterium]
MCGRYAAAKDVASLVEEFEVVRPPDENLPADYNVAPSKPVYMVVDRETDDGVQRQLRIAKWGLVPSWAKDPKIGNRMINARIETAAEKPAFRRAWAKRRCLLPADGYYEWYAGQGVPKQPFYIHRSDGASLAMAGLFEFWKDGEDWLVSTAILTTSAPDALGQIHDRMPLLVPRENWAKWLDPQGPPADDIVVPAMATGLEAYPVSTEVNNVKHNGPQLLEPLPAS